MTIEEKFELLTEENKRLVILEIERLAVQQGGQQSSDNQE